MIDDRRLRAIAREFRWKLFPPAIREQLTEACKPNAPPGFIAVHVTGNLARQAHVTVQGRLPGKGERLYPVRLARDAYESLIDVNAAMLED